MKLIVAAVLLCAWPVSAGVDGLTFVGKNEVNLHHEMDVEIVGNRAFVACGFSQGLEVYDISDPSAPVRTWLSSGPACWRTKSYGDTAIFAFCRRDGVVIYDIRGPGNPVRRGQYDPAGTREALEGGALVGDTLYCAAHQNGIYAVDVSDPSAPRRVGGLSLAPDGAGWNVAVRDSFLIVANGRFGLAVIGLEGGLHLSTTLELPGLANDLVLDDSVAVVSLGAHGLATVDVSDPRNPALLDTAGTDGSCWSLGRAGHLVAVGSWRVLELFDVSDPADIRRAGWDNTPVWAHGADIRSDSLICVADWRGIVCYRVGADEGPDIDVNPEVLDFGAVSAARETLWTVRNTGSGALNVTSVSVPSGFSADPAVFSVPAGDSQLVRVTASGTQRTSGNIAFNSNDPDQPSLAREVYKNNANFPQAGSVAPDFTLAGTDGRSHTLSSYRGRVVYIQFGASW